MAGTIMIVEDEPAVARGVQVALEREGYDVSVKPSGEDALESFSDTAPDLVVLDVRLPGMDGFEVLRQLRRETRAPVLFLTARADEVDKVVGLEIGADDYVAKPFNPRELVARMRAVLRRRADAPAPAEPAPVYAFGPFRLDAATHTLTRDGAPVALTTAEFTLLHLFVRHPRRVLTRDQLTTLVRDVERMPFDRSIDVRVARLRRKIEPNPDEPVYIRTVWGAGYLFVPHGDAT